MQFFCGAGTVIIDDEIEKNKCNRKAWETREEYNTSAKQETHSKSPKIANEIKINHSFLSLCLFFFSTSIVCFYFVHSTIFGVGLKWQYIHMACCQIIMFFDMPYVVLRLGILEEVLIITKAY